MVHVIPSASLCQEMGSQVLAGLMGRAGPQAVRKIVRAIGKGSIGGQPSPERLSVWSSWRVSLGAFSSY